MPRVMKGSQGSLAVTRVLVALQVHRQPSLPCFLLPHPVDRLGSFRTRRLPRSTALLVAGSNLSSSNVNAFSSFGACSLSRLLPKLG